MEILSTGPVSWDFSKICRHGHALRGGKVEARQKCSKENGRMDAEGKMSGDKNSEPA